MQDNSPVNTNQYINFQMMDWQGLKSDSTYTHKLLTSEVCAGEAPKIKEDTRRPIPENIPCDVFRAVQVIEFCNEKR